MNNNNERREMSDTILDGLESTPVSATEAREILTETGFDVGKELANFKARLTRRVRSRTWKAEADEKIAQFSGRGASREWRTASEDELNAAYIKLQETEYRMAARNLENLTRDEKIAILQDMEFLDEESEKSDS